MEGVWGLSNKTSVCPIDAYLHKSKNYIYIHTPPAPPNAGAALELEEEEERQGIGMGCCGKGGDFWLEATLQEVDREPSLSQLPPSACRRTADEEIEKNKNMGRSVPSGAPQTSLTHSCYTTSTVPTVPHSCHCAAYICCVYLPTCISQAGAYTTLGYLDGDRPGTHTPTRPTPEIHSLTTTTAEYLRNTVSHSNYRA